MAIYEINRIKPGDDIVMCHVPLRHEDKPFAVCGKDHTGQPSRVANRHAAILRRTEHPDFQPPLNAATEWRHGDWPVNEPWS